jgi:outer membrane protein
MKFKTLLFAAAVLSSATVNTAIAMDKGDWLMRFGGSYVDPKSTNHEVVKVDSAASLTFNFSYMMTANWAVEVLAAYPFEHDITLHDGTKVASTKHLPPTVSLQYHFAPAATFQPYLGLGINYTDFFSTETTGPLEGSHLTLTSSWGWAGQLGADIMLNEKWFLNLDVRYIDIETEAKLDGSSLGDVDISPWVYGANVGFRF